MRLFKILLLASIANTAFAAGRIQNEDVKSETDIKTAAGTITGNLSSGSPCIASPSSTAGLATGLYIYDSTTSANIPAGTTIAGLPGTCSSGQIQMSANAAGTATGDTITFGGQKSQLINDTKIYVTGNSLNKTLYEAITAGDFSGGGSSAGIYWNGYHQDNCLWSSTSTTNFTDNFGVDSSCTFTEGSIKTTGFPTVSSASSGGASNTLPGITFTANATMAPTSNKPYQICASFEFAHITNDGNSAFQMYDGTNTLWAGGQKSQAGSAGVFGTETTACGYILITSGNTYTITFVGKNSAGGMQIGNISAVAGQNRGINWWIRSL